MKRQQIRSRSRLVGKAMVLSLTFVHAMAFLPAQAGITEHSNAATVDRPFYKATWLWNTSSELNNKIRTFEFLQQNGVNLVYLQFDPDIAAGEYSSFIREASARGIEVHALGGAPDWIFRDRQIKLYKLIDWVKTYNEGVAAEERFKGIHLDVEPFVLQAWQSDADTMLGLWRDTVSGFVEQMKADTPQLIAGADLPVWLEKYNVPDGQGGRTTMSNWLIHKLDQTTLMAYRDNIPDIASSVATELGEAANNGKPAIVAVESAQSSDASISYYNKGRWQMIRDLSTIGDAISGKSSYAGYAVHDYESWNLMKE